MASNALASLPFAVSELGWDKFDEVQKAMKLDRDDTITVMKLACGDPPSDFDARLNLGTHQISPPPNS